MIGSGLALCGLATAMYIGAQLGRVDDPPGGRVHQRQVGRRAGREIGAVPAQPGDPGRGPGHPLGDELRRRVEEFRFFEEPADAGWRYGQGWAFGGPQPVHGA